MIKDRMLVYGVFRMNNQNIKTMDCQSCFAGLNTFAAKGNIIKCDYCEKNNILPEDMRKQGDVTAKGFVNRFYKQ